MADPKETVVQVSGLIGETSDFFKLPVKNLEHLILDLEKATYMNSVGVKHWISWTVKMPQQLKVTLKNCPFMIANQAAMVSGFLPKNFRIESFSAPFVCPDCEEETMIQLKRGVHYEYKSEIGAAWQSLPQEVCKKCKGSVRLEPDFFVEKIFKFLEI